VKVALGVSGSIAAYKACEVVRGLVQAGAQVRIVMTENAARFITPLTLSVLSKQAVHDDPYDPRLFDMAHLTLASWADLVLVAPATADLMSRLARGSSGGLLESLVLATKSPVALCPAMDTEMWEHPATRENAGRLRRYGCRLWGPVSGPLASGRVGMGRMMEPEEIVRRALGLLRGRSRTKRR